MCFWFQYSLLIATPEGVHSNLLPVYDKRNHFKPTRWCLILATHFDGGASPFHSMCSLLKSPHGNSHQKKISSRCSNLQFKSWVFLQPQRRGEAPGSGMSPILWLEATRRSGRQLNPQILGAWLGALAFALLRSPLAFSCPRLGLARRFAAVRCELRRPRTRTPSVISIFFYELWPRQMPSGSSSNTLKLECPSAIIQDNSKRYDHLIRFELSRHAKGLSYLEYRILKNIH